MEEKIGIIYCPAGNALSGKAKNRQRVEEILSASGLLYDYIQSESPEGVSRLFNMLVENGYQRIAIIGGDTALNDAVNCMMALPEGRRDTISLAIIPFTRRNDFAAFWGLSSKSLEKSIDVLSRGRSRRIDVGCLHYVDKEGKPCERYFINCVNIGLVASLQSLRRKTQKLFGSYTLAYFSSAFLIVTQRLGYKMHLNINGEDIRKNVMTVCVGNCSGYGQTPNAVPYSGRLDISLISNSSIGKLLSGVRLFFSRRFLMHSGVNAYRSHEIRVISSANAPITVDGRMLKGITGEYSISVIKEAINFVIP